jgi:hypothetical protein
MLFVSQKIYVELSQEYIRDDLANEMKERLGNGESLL